MPGPPFHTKVIGRAGPFAAPSSVYDHEEDVRVHIASVVVTNRQEAGPRRVFENLATHCDLVMGLGDVRRLVVLRRSRHRGEGKAHEQGEQ